MSVVIVASGGWPVTASTTGYGMPMVEASNGYGIPVTESLSGAGMPVTGITFGGGPGGSVGPIGLLFLMMGVR